MGGTSYRPAPFSGPAQGVLTPPPVVPPVENPEEKLKKQKRGLKAGLIAAGAVLVILVVWLIAASTGGKQQQAQATDGTGTIIAKVSGGTINSKSSATAEPTEEPAAEATSEPTAAPIENPDPIFITLDYGQSYQLTTRDFDLAYDISDSDVTWPDLLGTTGVYCDESGYLLAGNVPFDPSDGYNDYVTVQGTASDGTVLTYNVCVGDGQTYSFEKSQSARSLKNVMGHPLIATPSVENCLGFTLTYGYELSEGKINGTNWSVWLLKTEDEWVFLGDIEVTEGVYGDYPFTFDEPISFYQLIVQPPAQYDSFSYGNAYTVSDIVHSSY